MAEKPNNLSVGAGESGLQGYWNYPVPKGMQTDTATPKGSVKTMLAPQTPGITSPIPTPARVMASAQPVPTMADTEKATTPEQMMDTTLHPSTEPTAASPLREGEDIGPMKTETHVSSARVQQYLLARFNPIRNLNPRFWTQQMEQWDLGFLRIPALIWNKMRERDDVLAAVAVNRELRPTDMEWNCVPIDDSPEAKAHADALEYFYDNCSVTHCLDGNTRGGVQLLIRQMMRAVGDKFSVHEMVWNPDVDPETGQASLTGEFRFVPLWFSRTARGNCASCPTNWRCRASHWNRAAGWFMSRRVCGRRLRLPTFSRIWD